MFGRQSSVFGTAHDLRFDLLFDRRDANHEELVEIVAVDRNEFQTFEQRVTMRRALLRAPDR